MINDDPLAWLTLWQHLLLMHTTSVSVVLLGRLWLRFTMVEIHNG